MENWSKKKLIKRIEKLEWQVKLYREAIKKLVDTDNKVSEIRATQDGE